MVDINLDTTKTTTEKNAVGAAQESEPNVPDLLGNLSTIVRKEIPNINRIYFESKELDFDGKLKGSLEQFQSIIEFSVPDQKELESVHTEISHNLGHIGTISSELPPLTESITKDVKDIFEEKVDQIAIEESETILLREDTYLLNYYVNHVLASVN